MGNWDTLKELFDLTKPFHDFTACIEGRAITGTYGALWEVLPAIYKIVEEYERHATHYMALALSNQYMEDASNIEVNYILIFINNTLGKLYKYQELLPQSPAYAVAITMNPTFYWRWMKKKALHLLEYSQTNVLKLWEKDYNSKVIPTQLIVCTVGYGNKSSTFDDFLLTDDSNSFDGTIPIVWYHDYCEACLTLFSKCPNVIIWWESYEIINEPIFQMGWDIITIPTMSSEYKRVFSNAGRLITLVCNQLKKEIIEASECLNAWYKQESN